MLQKRINIWLLVIVGAGLLFRIYLSTFAFVGVDESADIYAGKNFLEGEGWRWPEGTFERPPIYPLLGALLFAVTKNPDFTASFIFVVFGCFIAVPVYLIAKRLYGEKVGYIAALIASFVPALNTTIMFTGNLAIFILFLYLGIYASLLAYQENRVLYYLLAGVFLTLGSFTRGEGQIYFLVIIIILLATRFIEKTLFMMESVRGLVFMFSLFLASFLILNTSILYKHDGVKKYSYYTFISGYARTYELREGDIWQKAQKLTDKLYGTAEENEYSILKAIKKNPKAFSLKFAKNIELFLKKLPSFSVFPFFLFLFVGLALPADEKEKKDTLFLLAVSTPVLTCLIFHVVERYLTVVVPVLIVWSSKGLCVFGDFLINTSLSDLKERTKALLIDTFYSLKGRIRASIDTFYPLKGRILVKVPLGVMVLFLFISSVRQDWAGDPRWFEVHKMAGEYLKNYAQKGERIIALHPQIALYGDLEYKFLPDLDCEQLIEYARENNVKYLFLTGNIARGHRPRLASLLEEEKYKEEVKVIMTGDVRGFKFVVCEFSRKERF